MSSSALELQNAMLRNFQNFWFLVQYERSPTICVRKVVRSSDFVSCQPLRECKSESNIYFIIRENGVKYLALLLFCSDNEGDVMSENLLLIFSSISLFKSQIHLSVAVDDPQLKDKLSYLVAYHREPTPDFIGNEVIFQIFSHEKVRLERDQQNLYVTKVFVQDQQITFEAALTKADLTLGDLMGDLKQIRGMRPSEIDPEDMNIVHEHPTDDHCNICVVIEMCVRQEPVRRVGLMNFQDFSRALLKQIY